MSIKTPSVDETRLLAMLSTVKFYTGRSIAKAYPRRWNKEISYGSLYVRFRRLQESGFVEILDSEDQDGLVRSFRITPTGEEALKAGEMKHAKKLTPKK